MFNIRRHMIAAFCAGSVVAAALATTQPASASPTTEPSSGDVIAIPMVVVPHETNSSAQPDIVIPGNCGTAFLYPSNGGDHVHYDFGFTKLNIIHYAVASHVGASNLDNGEAAVKSYSGASVSSSYEKQGNLYTGIGDNLVTAYIHAYGLTEDCVSSPNLHQDVYVY